MAVEWGNVGFVSTHSYRCGYCGDTVASEKGYLGIDRGLGLFGGIVICPSCAKPTFFSQEEQVPDVRPGNDVKGVPDNVADLYNEARSCVAASAYTASVLAC